jgi:hypothetical protein
VGVRRGRQPEIDLLVGDEQALVDQGLVEAGGDQAIVVVGVDPVDLPEEVAAAREQEPAGVPERAGKDGVDQSSLAGVGSGEAAGAMEGPVVAAGPVVAWDPFVAGPFAAGAGVSFGLRLKNAAILRQKTLMVTPTARRAATSPCQIMLPVPGSM